MSTEASSSTRRAAQLPDGTGHFDRFGGKFVPEALHAALAQLEAEFTAAVADPAFQAELQALLADYTGRPSPISEARRFAEHAAPASGGRPVIVLKREDLNHTGSHKINNVLGQALLARRMGKTRVIAETGAGQHGVATATAAALFGLDCTVYMGKVDTERQALNVARMRLLGAEVIAVESGTQTLKDAMNDAMRDWVATVESTHYLIGTVAGPHPFPMLVREFQRVIGTEARAQVLQRYGRLPDAVAACVGGGSNALGIFADFIDDADVALYGFEAGGDGVDTGRHAATISAGSVGVLHGMRTFVLQDEDGQTQDSHSISAGLDYPGVGPEHAWLAEVGRAHYEAVTDAEAMEAFRLLTRTEGIVPAIESAHALAGALELGPRLARPDNEPPLILVNLSGRGDKDVDTAIRWFDLDTKGTRSAGKCTQLRRPQRMTELGHTGRTFARAKDSGRGALVGFLHVGYPDVATSIRALKALTGEGDSPGVDLVEVGLPYSDPMMDGVTIQRAGTAALQRGVRTRDTFTAVEAVAGTGTPAVVMTYWNLIEQYGPMRFARDLAAAGAVGRDHAGPDPGRGRGVARGLRRPRPGSDLPGFAVVDRCPDRHNRRGLPGMVVRHRGDGCDRGPGDELVGRARPGGSGPRRGPRDHGWGRTGDLQRQPGRRGHRVRGRRDRGCRPRPDAAGRGGRRSAHDLSAYARMVADLADGVRGSRELTAPARG